MITKFNRTNFKFKSKKLMKHKVNLIQFIEIPSLDKIKFKKKQIRSTIKDIWFQFNSKT